VDEFSPLTGLYAIAVPSEIVNVFKAVAAEKIYRFLKKEKFDRRFPKSATGFESLLPLSDGVY